ncbi:hypothetical protein GOHSU_22_01100 [Gordonia hirsuta DSM 44140 = NBRC 16056]|uniref:Acyltransferase 3 domain-containing protein n=1 Tax=Gordonia hirsuta DSM 44140 = NBRC 16056 TaxID=1121927 RepID=L7L928_9ACTN|nr:OpgC domain-containing protein [Gordonia hirsuta]GAC57650.1 hypothetical protein GOHSU_22_01100 [Gordonia hirsuta DSM 44140 = NBRC 16056]
MTGKRTASGRDLAIDGTRGVAIWSMVSLHFANGMLIALPTHAYPFVDGMSAFVLLSGLVLGLVHRRWIARHDLDFAYRNLAKRVGVLYLAQLSIALFAVAAGMFLTAGQFRMLTVLPPDLPLAQQLWWAVTMRFLPSGGSILVVYMVLMTLAFGVLPLLARGRWQLVLAISVAGYTVSQLTSADWMVIYSSPVTGPVQNWLAWQILFIPAMVVGWHWTDWQLPQRLDAAAPALLGITAALWVALFYGWRSGAFTHATALVSKVNLGPIRALAAWLVVTAVYVLFRRLLQWKYHVWSRPLVMVGARSLDSYVIQALALVAIPMLVVFRPWGPGVSTAVTVAVFAACWGWAEFRRHLQVDKLHRLPAILSARAGRRPADEPESASSEGERRDHTARITTGSGATRWPRRTDAERARRESAAH